MSIDLDRIGRLYDYPLSNNQGTTGQEVDTPAPPRLPPSAYDSIPSPSFDPRIDPGMISGGRGSRLPYDNVGPGSLPEETDPRFSMPANPNPNGDDLGVEGITPRGRQWIEDNIWSQGYSIDLVTGTILDAEGNVVGQLPRVIPQMI